MNRKLWTLVVAIAIIGAYALKEHQGMAMDSVPGPGVEEEQSKGTQDTKAESEDESGQRKAKKATVRYEIPAPLTDRDEQIIEHTGFVVSYNKKHNTPNWSAWHLTAKHADGEVPRGTKFWEDEKVAKAYRVGYYEYKGSGYDRGHMCPASDNKWSYDAMHDCFYMTNMCPQDPSLNSGSWKQLEEACRRWALREGSVYIVCGPIYKGKKHEKIGIEHSIDVPEGFFKAVLSLRKGKEKAIAFIYKNDASRQPMSDTATSVDKAEEITGMDLFHELDDELEARLERSFSLTDWEGKNR